MDFTVIARAGITQMEFAELLHVSRVTINTWVGGTMKPNRFVASKVERVLSLLEGAITAGKLPLAKDVSAMNRPASILGAMRDAAGATVSAVAEAG